jgi:elongation factor P
VSARHCPGHADLIASAPRPQPALLFPCAKTAAMKIIGNSIRPGMVIDHQGKLWRVAKISRSQREQREAYTQAELKDVRDGTKLIARFASQEAVERVRLEEKEHQYLYADGDMYTFMDNETYEQVAVGADTIGQDQVPFLKENMTVTIDLHEGRPIAVRLPDSVVLTVVEADPVVRGQTAASSYKPAVLENGVRTLVPPHIEAGAKIVVSTADGSYVERAKG